MIMNSCGLYIATNTVKKRKLITKTMKQAATEAKLQASNAAAKEIFSQQKTKEVEELQSEISDLKKRLQQIQHDKSQVRMLLDDVYN